MRNYTKRPIDNDEVRTYLKNRVKLDDATGCWIWSMRLDRDGYGELDRDIRAFKHCGTARVHRAAYMVFNGPLPDGLHVRHSCDNRACCNPEHLSTGTAQQNADDKTKPTRRKSNEALVYRRKALLSRLAEVEAEMAKRGLSF